MKKTPKINYELLDSNEVEVEIISRISIEQENISSSSIFENNNNNNNESSNDNYSSIFAASMNFVNSIVGAGIIGMPVAIREAGFFVGVFFLLFVGLIINRSVIMLVECGIKCNKNNFEELCYYLYGKRGYDTASLFMFLYAFGAMIAYMVIIGDTVPVALSYFFDNTIHISREITILFAAVFIILPLCMLRDMSSLAWTSFLSILADITMIIFVIIAGPSSANEQNTKFHAKTDLNFINYQLFLGIGTFSFAFVCQHNTFLVYQTLKTKNLYNWSLVAHISLSIAVTLCLILGLSGYLCFGQYTEGDILNNFLESDKMILIARLLLASTMVFTFPMECYVARHIIISYYEFFSKIQADNLETGSTFNSNIRNFRRQQMIQTPSRRNPIQFQRLENQSSSSSSSSSQISPFHSLNSLYSLNSLTNNNNINNNNNSISNDETLNNIQSTSNDHSKSSLFTHITLTLFLWGITVTIAIIFHELSIVLALTGAIAASMLGYILPSIIYFKTYRYDLNKALSSFNQHSEYYQPKFTLRFKLISKFILPSFLFIFGIMILFIGVGSVILEYVNPNIEE